ncbi:MAG: exodeoxyribonuclease III [Crocinitomicaceae bacterium]
MAKIISYNVNGIRAAINKDFAAWLKAADPDVVCIQETKAQPDQIDTQLFASMGYHSYTVSAEKKGYSGVMILSKKEPDHIEKGCGIEYIDQEGRIIRADYGDLSIMSVYIPSGSSGEVRQDLKMQFLDDFYNYIQELRKSRPQIIISGDYNICHKAIDIHNPVSNKNTSGFLPEERAWVDKFVESGFIDTFRVFNQEPHNYTWWTYRMNARANNKGWRIDYHMATANLEPELKRAVILSEAVHSDHCPILLELKNDL